MSRPPRTLPPRVALALAAAGAALACASGAWAQGAPTNVALADVPNDNGRALAVTWEAPAEAEGLTGYRVSFAPQPSPPAEPTEWTVAAAFPADILTASYDQLERGQAYYTRVEALYGEETAVASEAAGPLPPTAAWFNTDKSAVFLIGLVICAFIIWFIRRARGGADLFVRKLAGLDAVDEALGRATEMGRPVLFVPGILDVNDVQTLAGLTILGHVSKTIAEYDTELNCPVSKSLVMTTGREVVRQAYLEAGRPDAYSDDLVHYITDDQFGYVAGINGIIVRDEPATCIYMGGFFAESLILAETGFSSGAIQIAGTAQPSQLPFFVAACDYTLIGEELFAASAYLSGDPKQLGSLKGQDVGKAIAMASLAIGSLFATLAAVTDAKWANDLLGWFAGIFQG
jgi:hypothetical protein